MMRRTEYTVTVPDLVEAMQRLGASFFFSQAGTLLVRGLNALPCYLRDSFYECDGKSLVAYVKAIQSKGQQGPAVERE